MELWRKVVERSRTVVRHSRNDLELSKNYFQCITCQATYFGCTLWETLGLSLGFCLSIRGLTLKSISRGRMRKRRTSRKTRNQHLSINSSKICSFHWQHCQPGGCLSKPDSLLILQSSILELFLFVAAECGYYACRLCKINLFYVGSFSGKSDFSCLALHRNKLQDF